MKFLWKFVNFLAILTDASCNLIWNLTIAFVGFKNLASNRYASSETMHLFFIRLIYF